MDSLHKPKVLFLLQIPPPVHGSSIVGQYIRNSSLINNSFNCQFINLITSATINEIGRNSILKIYKILKISIKILASVLKDKPDLCYFAVNITGKAFYRDVLIISFLKLTRINLVYHLHGKGIIHRQNRTLDDFLYKKVFSGSKVILLSPLLYYDIKKYVLEDSVFYCANGIPDLFGKKKCAFLRKNNTVTRILFLSNLIKSKGVFELLEALKILKGHGIKFKCVFVGEEGDINQQEFIKKSQSLGLDDVAVYLGGKTGIDKEIEFSKADIFVLPTYKDCYPLVILEAMNYSLPIITTNEGGIPDLVENGSNGLLVSAHNPDELSEALVLLINDKQLREDMGAKARIKYENNHTINHFENTLLSILNSCLIER